MNRYVIGISLFKEHGYVLNFVVRKKRLSIDFSTLDLKDRAVRG